MTTLLRTSILLTLALALSGGAAVQAQLQRSDAAAHRVPGTWYLALDAAPFGLPPGTNLPGLAQFHSDRTFRIVDGGDFGGLPFMAVDSTMVGVWRPLGGGRILAVGLFLQGDAMSGEVQSWQRVELELEAQGRNSLRGKVNVYALPCDLPAPFPVFGCPSPVAGDGFQALPPFDIPVALERLRARRVSE